MRGINLSLLIVIAAVLAILALPGAFSQAIHYADIEINVGENGNALISGLTNHPSLLAGEYPDFTSKKADYWLFNLTLDDEFLAFAYTVNLPANAEINYVKTSTQFRIGAGAERPFVKGTGENAPLRIAIQYTLGATPAKGFEIMGINGYTVLIVAFVVIVLVAILLFLMKFGRKPKKDSKTEGKEAGIVNNDAAGKKPWYNKALLPSRQKQIVEMLEESGKPITQKQIESLSSIPKASLSRNIDALVKKGIIKKEPHGMANIIYISEEPPKIN